MSKVTHFVIFFSLLFSQLTSAAIIFSSNKRGSAVHSTEGSLQERGERQFFWLKTRNAI
jgi:hypothetical protein